MLIAATISVRALKRAEELWNEEIVRGQTTDACSNSKTLEMALYLEEGAVYSRMTTAMRGDDEDAQKEATAELLDFMKKRSERLAAELARTRADAAQGQGEPPK